MVLTYWANEGAIQNLKQKDTVNKQIPSVSVGESAEILFVVLEHIHNPFTDIVHSDGEAQKLRLGPHVC